MTFSQLAEQKGRADWAGERGREGKSGLGGERWKPMLEELHYRSLFSLSFSRPLWATSKRWCSHDPAQYTDILFNPASMKFLQIKPLCQATANYLTDWPPSGSGYSVEWQCCRNPTAHTHMDTHHQQQPSPTLSTPHPPSLGAKRGHFEKIPQGLILFRRLYISSPHPTSTTFHPPPSPSLSLTIYPSKIRRAWCICVYYGVCVCVCTGGGGLSVTDSSHFIV